MLSEKTKVEIVKFWENVRMLFEKFDDMQVQSLFNWLSDFALLLLRNSNFDPSKLPHLKKGHIIWVKFGFNVGSELWGTRPAVVLEADNAKSDGNVIVAPIRSYQKQGPKKLITWLVYVGDHESLHEKSYVDLKHLKSISKMRIISKKTNSGSRKIIHGKLHDKHLNDIDRKLIEVFNIKNLT